MGIRKEGLATPLACVSCGASLCVLCTLPSKVWLVLELCNGGSLKDAVTCGRIRTNSCQDLVSNLSGAGSMYCAVLLRSLCWTDWLSASWHPGGLGDCNADGHAWCVHARVRRPGCCLGCWMQRMAWRTCTTRE